MQPIMEFLRPGYVYLDSRTNGKTVGREGEAPYTERTHI